MIENRSAMREKAPLNQVRIKRNPACHSARPLMIFGLEKCYPRMWIGRVIDNDNDVAKFAPLRAEMPHRMIDLVPDLVGCAVVLCGPHGPQARSTRPMR